MTNMDELVTYFTQKAQAVSAVVAEVNELRQAFEYTVDLCDRKEACQLLLAGCEAPLSPAAGDLCQRRQDKIVAAPGLDAADYQELNTLCRNKGLSLIQDGLRGYLAGIDIGLTVIDYGIAETGTLVLNSNTEEVRLATMISEIHVAVLPKSRLRQSSTDLETELETMMRVRPGYTAFITGASRTADIERVLALGGHGPLELHILLWEDR
ncbi:MAG: lactate utilization protein [Deltaproteobacteria bacterium]|nr:lactate utilization protein [Deltaproteobacteria bacterium]